MLWQSTTESTPISVSPLVRQGISFRKKRVKRGKAFESDIDMSLSNCSIGADAPAATFGKTAALEVV